MEHLLQFQIPLWIIGSSSTAAVQVFWLHTMGFDFPCISWCASSKLDTYAHPLHTYIHTLNKKWMLGVYTFIWHSDPFVLACNLLAENQLLFYSLLPLQAQIHIFPFAAKMNLHIFIWKCHLVAGLWVLYAGSCLFPFSVCNLVRGVWKGYQQGPFRWEWSCIPRDSLWHLYLVAYNLSTLYYVSSHFSFLSAKSHKYQ